VEVAKQFNDRVHKDFAGVVGNEALLLQQGMLVTASFTTTHVNAIPCMTSQEMVAKKVKCKVTFNDIAAFNVDIVYCDPKCIEMGLPVYGSGVYSSNSSVCTAMLHSGQ